MMETRSNPKHLHRTSDPVHTKETDYFSYRPTPSRAATDLGLGKLELSHELIVTSADELEYFAEGSSNVLFRYIGEDEELRPRLLRFRKQRSKSRTTEQLHDDIQKRFIPVLSSYVVKTGLCTISPGVIKSLNERLANKSVHSDDNGDEGYHDSEREDADLLDDSDEYALAVEDMSPGIYQKHNEITHNRNTRRRMQFPFLSPRNSNASLVSGENSEVNSGYNSDAEAFFSDEESESGRERRKRSKLPIPKKRDLDPARLSARNWRDLLTVRFRPGTLVQPTGAPPGWSICHDCAVRNMDSSLATTAAAADSGSSDCSEESNTPQPYCPLDLISRDAARVHAAIESVISRMHSVKILDEEEVVVNDPALGIAGITPWLDVLEYSIVNILVDYFWDEGSIGHLLKQLQSIEELNGLRDCTLYVRLWMRCKEDDNYEVHIECKVGGLDNESASSKDEKNLEDQLVRGAWYLGRSFHGAICRRE